MPNPFDSSPNIAPAPNVDSSARMLGKDDLRQLQIIKQSVIKSLIEARAVVEIDEPNIRLVEGWVRYIVRNSPYDYDLYHGNNQ